MEQDDKFRFAEPCNTPGVTCWSRRGRCCYLFLLRHFSRARWMRPPANRTMKCCGSGNRGSGSLLRWERAESEVTSIQAYKLLTIKLLYSMIL